MADNQGAIAFICETLLTADSAPERALQGLDNTGLLQGTRAFCVDIGDIYTLYPASAVAQSLPDILTAYGGGRWIRGSSPTGGVVEVTSTAQLPDAAAGVITLVAGRTYVFKGNVDLGTSRLQASSGTTITGVGALIYTTNAAAVITGPTGLPWQISNVTVQNSGAGPAISWNGNGVGNRMRMSHVRTITTGTGCVLTGGDSDDIIDVIDCEFGGTTIGLQIAGTWGKCSFDGCQFPGTGHCVDIGNGVTVSALLFSGCAFEVGAGDTGINQNAGATVTEGRLSGNIFTGGGTFKSASVVGAAWEGKANVGVADF